MPENIIAAHGGTTPPPIPPAFETLPQPTPPDDYSVKDLFDEVVWKNSILPYVSSIDASLAASVDGHVLRAVQAVRADRHFIAERAFGDALGELQAAEARGAAEAAPRRVSEDALNTATDAHQRKPMGTAISLSLAIDYIAKSKAFRIARIKCAEARAIMSEVCLTNTTWRPVSVDERGHGTYYRGEPGLTTLSFKVVGVVHAEVVALACVLLELDLYKEWFPFCHYSQIITEDGQFHKTSRFAIRLPWPLANREVVITGFGLDDLDKMRVIVKASSVPNMTPLKGNVTCDVALGGFFIEPIGKRDTKLAFLMNIDPHVPHVPGWVLNWISGNLMWVVLRQMSKAAEKAMDPESIYAKRRRERADVYAYFTERAKEITAQLPAHVEK